MATTKQLLERMTQKVASNAIGRSPTTYVDIAVDTTSTDWQRYTPPSDGFVWLHTEGTVSQMMQTKDYYTNSIPSIENLYMGAKWGIFTPRCCKGRTFLFRNYNARTIFEMKFIPSIGGGYKSLLQTLERGRLLCLRLSRLLTLPLKQGASSLCHKGTQSRFSPSQPTHRILYRGQTHTITPRHRMASSVATTWQKSIRTSTIRTQAQMLNIWGPIQEGVGHLFGKAFEQKLSALTQLQSRLANSIPCSVKSSLALEGGY